MIELQIRQRLNIDPSRMVIRNFERRPLRAAFTVTGIALAVALQISGAFWLDAIALTDVLNENARSDWLRANTST